MPSKLQNEVHSAAQFVKDIRILIPIFAVAILVVVAFGFRFLPEYADVSNVARASDFVSIEERQDSLSFKVNSNTATLRILCVQFDSLNSQLNSMQREQANLRKLQLNVLIQTSRLPESQMIRLLRDLNSGYISEDSVMKILDRQ